MKNIRFDWDEHNLAKCLARCPRHEIEEFLSDGEAIVTADPHEGEARMRAIGSNRDGRQMFVVFTVRMVKGEAHLRPISARYMHAKEALKWLKS